MAKAKPKRHRRLDDPDWGLVYKFATALEKGNFNEYIAILRDPKALFYRSIIAGIGKGMGTAFGVLLAGTVLAGLLVALSQVVPDPLDNTLENTGKQLEQSAPK